MKTRNRLLTLAALGVAGFGSTLLATETENLGIRILPTPGQMTIDGRTNDWDLSGGVFVCGDVEHLRGRLATWIHVMYDKDNVYILSRWSDDTPMNHPGSVSGDQGFNGDSLQFRMLVANANPEFKEKPEPNTQRTTHVTAWRDIDGKDVIDLAYGIHFNQGGIKDAKSQGGAQAFTKNEDGKGYVQEIAIPWKLIAPDGWKPVVDQSIILTVEPNFGTEQKLRITLKDLFRAGVKPDRAFTFMASSCWGVGTFAASGGVQPQALQLADARKFPVSMTGGVPTIEWSGLYKEKPMEGFAKIAFEMPNDGFVSLNIRNPEGQVVRQLLTANFFAKGKHEIKWDGLTNLSHLKPGNPVEPGTYTWQAIYHGGLGLRLVGWADNDGKTPYDSPGGNWGGDHGMPAAVVADGENVYLGWNGSEAGKALVCTDLNGVLKWSHKNGGFGGANHIAVGKGIVYVNDGYDSVIYRLDTQTGSYNLWEGSDLAVLSIGKGVEGLAYIDDKLYVSQAGAIRVLNAATGKEINKIAISSPGDLEVGADGSLYVLSDGKQVLRVKADGTATPAVTGLTNARGLALAKNGEIYVGALDPDNQVKVFSADGKLLRSIGKQGGRPLLGAWDANGLRFISGLSLDPTGKLWVAERDDRPKRFSSWNSQDGTFVKEFFGPTAYGAGGGAISPVDPLVMVGSGCEWKLDAQTGLASCVAVIARGEMHGSRFGQSPEGRVYVAVSGSWEKGNSPVSIYERLDAGQYKLRTVIAPLSGRGGGGGARIWSDANDDQKEQPDEVREYRKDLQGWITGWYMPMTQSMTFYGGSYAVAPTSWTACGAPIYDLAQAKAMAAPADLRNRGGMGTQKSMGSSDGKLIVYNGRYGESHSDFVCFDDTGKLKWTYPNNYVGVHGGHSAPPPQVGLIRAAYDFIGSAKLPDPIGDVFVVATDKGEWHMLTGEGFYLSHLFEANPLNIKWPEKAIPGAIMDNSPPGMGSEDFGGSMILGKDGQLYIQAGKTAFMNMKVVGLDTVKALPGGTITVSSSDTGLAKNFREALLQKSVGTHQYLVNKGSPAFTGNLQNDFKTTERMKFQKSDATSVEAAMAYDDKNLYLAWQVRDETPWVNGASDPAQMYAMGDTVDFQFNPNPKADRDRAKPVLGDLRLSIGNFKGAPKAVIYRPFSDDKAPRKFFSGTVKDGYEMQSVKVLDDAQIKVTLDPRGKSYLVQAAIPLESLGLKPVSETSYTGDMGVTFGDAEGKDTVQRSYWNNQQTGLIADEVWELVPDPKNWGQLHFK